MYAALRSTSACCLKLLYTFVLWYEALSCQCMRPQGGMHLHLQHLQLCERRCTGACCGALLISTTAPPHLNNSSSSSQQHLSTTAPLRHATAYTYLAASTLVAPETPHLNNTSSESRATPYPANARAHTSARQLRMLMGEQGVQKERRAW